MNVWAQSPIEHGATAEFKEPAFNAWQEFIEGEKEKAPSELRQMFQSSDSWPLMTKEMAFLSSSIQGIYISLSFAFVVLLLVTLDLIVSIVSLFCIGSILVSFVAMMQMLGW